MRKSIRCRASGLRDQSRNLELSLVALRVGVEDAELDRVVSQGCQQAIVQIHSDISITRGIGEALTCSPPLDQIAERQAVGRDRLVVDEAVLGVADDLDVVVDGVAQHQLGLGSVRGEGQILRRRTHTATALVLVEQRSQVGEGAGGDVEFVDDAAREGNEAKDVPARGALLDDIALAVVAVIRSKICVRPWQPKLLGENRLEVAPRIPANECVLNGAPDRTR